METTGEVITSLPIPAAILLFGSGALGLLLIGRREKNPRQRADENRIARAKALHARWQTAIANGETTDYTRMPRKMGAR